MAKSNLNVYFDHYADFGEQTLAEDLVIEMIEIFGMEVYYCPRTLKNFNEVYGEDSVSQYRSSYYIPMFIKSINNFGGDGDFLSKFNLQIRDTVTLTVARRPFADEIGSVANIDRPQEGDLIFFPQNNKIFVIKFVEHEVPFYQFGGLQTWDLDCELWEYSNEILATGIAQIDQLQKNFAFDLTSWTIQTEDAYRITDESGYTLTQEQFDYETQVGDYLTENIEIQDEVEEFLDFTQINPLGNNE